MHFFCQLPCFGQAIAEGSKVAGATTIKRQARQGAVQIGHIAQVLADIATDGRRIIGKGNGVQTGLNRL